MITAIIIDDEYEGRQALVQKVKLFCPSIRLLAECDNVEDATKTIQRLRPQLIFLDIHLNRQSGFDLLARFPNPFFQVIFVTGFNNYAIQAFKFCALDYLLKPVDTKELVEAVEKAQQQIELEQIKLKYLLQNLETQQKHKKIMVIPSLEQDEFVSLADIVRFEAQGGYTFIYKKDQTKICASKNLKHFEDALEGTSTFFRIHHKHVINIECVERYDRKDSVAVLKNKQHIPVAKRRRTQFIEFMRTYKT